jgi:signal transduction histidine kinase
MDAAPPPTSDMPEPAPGSPVVAERRSELLLDALKSALGSPGEHRLFRFGRLAGLFPSRAGLSAEAAGLAVRTGLLEATRTEQRGKLIVEWVQATAKAVAYVHEHDSPKSVLREFKEVLEAARGGLPQWMTETKAELVDLSYRFDRRASAMLKQLEELAQRVEAALRRAELKAPAVAEPVSRLVPWAIDALEYLDHRKEGGASGDCPLPELFHAVRVRFPDLALPAFQDGIKRLHDVRAVRLAPSAMMVEPEFAVLAEGNLMYAAAR